MITTELVLAAIGFLFTWTCTVVTMMIWLSGKFRGLEIAIYKEAAKSHSEIDRLKSRVQRLEIKIFGYTGGFNVTTADMLEQDLHKN